MLCNLSYILSAPGIILSGIQAHPLPRPPPDWVKLYGPPVDRTDVIATNRNNMKLTSRFLACLLTVMAGAAIFCLPVALAQPSSQDLASSVADRETQIYELRTEITTLEAFIVDREQALDRQRQELAAVSHRLREAEDRYNVTVRLYEGRLTALYKLDTNYGFEAVIASESLSEAAATLAYLDSIADNDHRLLERVKAEENEVRKLRERIDGLKQLQSSDVESLKQRRQELEHQAQAESRSLESDRRELEARIQKEQEEDERLLASMAPVAEIPYEPDGPVEVAPPPGLAPTGIVLTGVASWYGPGFHGNRTANGEIYNMNAYTAAHKTLPFNTWVKVTAANGRSVFVRINDRGPYVGGRIIDLSKAGAEAIGISGIGQVRVEVYR